MTERLDIETLIERMAAGVRDIVAAETKPILLVGIHSGGAWLAQRLHAQLDLDTPLGSLDISFYRDDFSRKGMHPEVRPSRLPLSVTDRTVVLIDDVLYSGRTVRAALNELFDYGRPATVRLAVLIDRDGRELPIAADIAGQQLALGPDESIKLHGPDPLSIDVRRQTP